MIQARKMFRAVLALVFYSSCAIGAYGRSSSSLRSLTGQTGESMSFLAWIILGLVAGFIGSKIVNRRGEGILLDILLGVVGAFAGGWLFRIFGAPGVSGLNLYSIFVAVMGSAVLLILYHALRGKRAW
ncbi:MAG TPA: GlsB/YeaQ/YmgE family stress response membrane protein [Bryobacteraceae bacterium]|nr:GlsB/YeaQ/YmgE family stress response membrane protein [Bryobacteraceae bacterium]